jgi:hypothetical protein
MSKQIFIGKIPALGRTLKTATTTPSAAADVKNDKNKTSPGELGKAAH